jgi:peptide methionine sulfoxide reductase msrA/msrB
MFSIRPLQTLLLTLGLGVLLGACAKESNSGAPAGKPRINPNVQLDSIVLGMGCFWGAEKRMAELPGVMDVESGYANGDIEGRYEAVLAQERALRLGMSKKRNHAEVVKVSYDPAKTTLEAVLAKFWESHDPTQGDRQGNDVGSNYRSAVYTRSPAQLETAKKTRDVYQAALTQAGRGAITTEIYTTYDTLSLHDALPIWSCWRFPAGPGSGYRWRCGSCCPRRCPGGRPGWDRGFPRTWPARLPGWSWTDRR